MLMDGYSLAVIRGPFKVNPIKHGQVFRSICIQTFEHTARTLYEGDTNQVV